MGQVERETFSGWRTPGCRRRRPGRSATTTARSIGTFGISARHQPPRSGPSSRCWPGRWSWAPRTSGCASWDGPKDEFVSPSTSCAPLTSIIFGYIQLLRDERASGLDTDHFAEVIERNAERLLRLVGDLLFLSKMQSSGQLALELRGDRPGAAGEAADVRRRSASTSAWPRPRPRFRAPWTQPASPSCSGTSSPTR